MGAPSIPSMPPPSLSSGSPICPWLYPDRLCGLGQVIIPLVPQFPLYKVGTVTLCTGLGGCYGECWGTSGPGPMTLSVWLCPCTLLSSPLPRLLGVDKVLGYALNEWLQDIRKNQLPGLLGGVGPMHSVVQLCE